MTRNCLYLQLKEKVLLRQQGSYILAVEAGKQLLLSADSGAEAALQAELTEIQERWKKVSTQLEEQKKQVTLLLKVSILGFFSVLSSSLFLILNHDEEKYS